MSSDDPLAFLEASERNRLEALLMNFDQAWQPSAFDAFMARLDLNQNQKFRDLALAEMVKIDLQRAWSSGKGRMLDEYLTRFPSLGTADSVDADLIAAEFDARKAASPDIALSSYQSRFPKQFDQVERMVRRGTTSSRTNSSGIGSQPHQASIDTSRIDEALDTKGGRDAAPMIDLPTEFGRYRILEELGAGAMGKVYLAHDTQLDRKVALKTPSFGGHEKKDLVARFYREARAAAKLHHPNICPIFDVGEIDGRHFISMAFVKGRCLSEFIQPSKLPPTRTSAILVQRLAVAMAEAHRHNVIHRDLKPANIIIDQKKQPIVMDFGLARELDSKSQFTQDGTAVGTPAYMSPEQIRGELDDVGTTADIYALGVILHELLCGQLPFHGPIAKVVYSIVHDQPEPPSKRREGVDPDLEAICAKMMAKDKNERYQSMDEVADVLARYLKGSRHQRKSDTPQAKADTSNAESISAKVSETGALNAFFAAQVDGSQPRVLGTEDPPAAPIAIKSEPKNGPPKIASRRARNAGRNRNRPALIALAASVGGLLILGMTMWLNVGDAVLQVEINDPSIGVTVQNQTLTIDDNGRNIELRPKENNRLSISVGETRFQTARNFELVKGENPVVQVTLLSDELVAKQGKRELGRWPLEKAGPIDRSIWVHKAGFFGLQDDGEWLEISPNGRHYRYAESSRTPDYVQLRALSGNISTRIRLFPDRAEFASVTDKQFEKRFDGWWHTLASDSEKDSLTAPRLKPGMQFEGNNDWKKVDAAFPRGTQQAWEMRIDGVDGPKFWGVVKYQWTEKWVPFDGLSIGEQIQWTNRRHGFTAYGTFDGAKIHAVTGGSVHIARLTVNPADSPLSDDSPDSLQNPSDSAKVGSSERKSPYEILTSPDYEWTQPVFIGTFDTADNLDVALTDDMTTFLTVTRALPSLMAHPNVKNDIWLLTRAPGAQRWDIPLHQGTNVSLPNRKDQDPTISPDGLELIFSSDRPGGPGTGDLWICRRKKPDHPWSAAVNMGRPINGGGWEWSCRISPNGLELYYASNRPASIRGSGDIFCSRRAALGKPWGPPTNCQRINSSQQEYAPVLSSDGRVMCFLSKGRPGGKGLADIWMSTRQDLEDRWSDPVNLPEPINSAGHDTPILLSPDGSLLLFARHGEGLMSSRRVPKGTSYN